MKKKSKLDRLIYLLDYLETWVSNKWEEQLGEKMSTTAYNEDCGHLAEELWTLWGMATARCQTQDEDGRNW